MQSSLLAKKVSSVEKEPFMTEHQNIQVNGTQDMITDPVTVFHETPFGKGLGNTLKVIRDRGWLNENDDEFGDDDGEIAATRRKNNSSAHKNKGRYDFEDIQIVRRDRHGRELSTKQAYRELCHAFHGKQPSKKTIEKRERQMGMKTQKPTGNQDLLALDRSLEAAQSPYVVISTGERKKSRVYRKVRLYHATGTLVPPTTRSTR